MRRGAFIRRLAVNALLVLLSLTAALVAAEVFLHLLNPGRSLPTSTLFYEHDNLLGWRKIPNKEGVLVQPEYAVHKKINSKGLRGREYSYERPSSGIFRVLCLGDSYCEGYAVELRDLFTERLEKLLNARTDGWRYEVINGGTGGYSTDQELLFFETEGHKYRPDLVILLFYYNDVVVNTMPTYWGAQKPMFRLQGGKLRLTNVPVPKVTKRAASAQSIGQWLSSNSRIYSFLADRFGWMLHAWFGSASSQKMPPSYREFIVFQSSPSADTRRAWEVTEALLRRLKRDVASTGAQLVVFRVPFKATIYRDEFRSLERRWHVPEELCDPDRPRKDLTAVCRRLSIPLIDPQKRFEGRAEALSARGKRLYFKLDDHWNKEGNELVADILYEYIIRHQASGSGRLAKRRTEPPS